MADNRINARAPEPSRASQGPHWRAWQRAHDAAPEAFRWTRKMVHDRLLETAETIRMTSGYVGPREFGTAMPEYVPDEHGVNDREVASADRVSRMEAAMRWQALFLADAPFHDVKALKRWFRCAVMGRSFRGYCRKKGANPETEKARRDSAQLVIATGLIRERVPCDVPREAAEPEKPAGWAGVLATVPTSPAAAIVVDLPEWWPAALAVARQCPPSDLSEAHKLLWRNIADDFPAGMPTYSLRKVRFAVLKRELKRQLGEGGDGR